MWWVGLAAAAELDGFQRVWVAAETLALTPTAPASPVEIAGVLVVLNPGVDPATVVELARASGLQAVVDDTRVAVQGAAAADLPLAAYGEVKPIPALRSHLPSPAAVLRIENPLARRVEVTVNGVAVGRLIPRAVGTISGVAAGTYAVVLTGPDGERREAALETVGAVPTR
jgi:hypothetical protein